MRPFERKYTAAQIQAIYDARFAKGLTYRRIVKAAQEGDLGDLGAFAISNEYVGELCRKESKRRAGKVESHLADKPHKDAIEILRRRMISAADSLSRHHAELAEKHPEQADPARGREIIRLIREAASLPTLKEDTPPAPGAQRDGQRHGAETKGGLAGSLLAAHRNGQGAQQPAPQHGFETGEAEGGERTGARTLDRSESLAA